MSSDLQVLLAGACGCASDAHVLATLSQISASAKIIPIVEIETSKKQVFQSAAGGTMPNHVERALLSKAPSGRPKTLKKHVCDCTGPFASITNVCDNDPSVGLGKTGGFILDFV